MVCMYTSVPAFCCRYCGGTVFAVALPLPPQLRQSHFRTTCSGLLSSHNTHTSTTIDPHSISFSCTEIRLGRSAVPTHGPICSASAATPGGCHRPTSLVRPATLPGGAHYSPPPPPVIPATVPPGEGIATRSTSGFSRIIRRRFYCSTAHSPFDCDSRLVRYR
jgi:hypothetical protein